MDAEHVQIIVDTREQKPYSFRKYPAEISREALRTGDYSLVDMAGMITVERKSKNDLYSTLGQRRDAFKAEFKRMADMEYAALVIESTLSGLMTAPARSRLHPNSVINTLLAWSVAYNIPIFFAGKRKLAEAVTFRILEKFWKYNASPPAK